jgi:thymidylate synthase (FAD)
VECPESPRRHPGGRREAYEAYARALREARGLPEEEAGLVAHRAYLIPPSLWRSGVLGAVSGLLLEATARYYEALSGGARREDARYLLPSSVRTRLVVTMNARELVQVFLPLRMCTRAQWEVRLVAWEMWRLLARTHPRLFRYAGPSCVFEENTLRARPATLEDYLSGRTGFTIPRCPELVENRAIPACLRAASSPISQPATADNYTATSEQD